LSSYKIPENLAVSDSGFLFMPSTGETYTLNHMGKEIFRLIQSGTDEVSIVNQIVSEYEIDNNSFEKDLHDFISQLKNYSLIK